MHLDWCCMVGLALCVVFSPNVDAANRIKCPENCSPQQTGVKNLARLVQEACTMSITFAYEVRLENTDSSLSTDAYNMTILSTFKDDVEDPTDETRVFISRPTCKTKLNMRPGNKYLIMGKSAKEVAGKYHYMFDDQTWLQYWPTNSEGKSSAFKSQFDNLEQFRNDMQFGCTIG